MTSILAASCTNLKAAAADCGVPYARLKDALNSNEPQPFHAAWLVPFMRSTQSIEPLRWLAEQMGCAVVRLPEATAGHADIHDRFLKAVEELGQDSAAIQRALADGQITASEGRTVAAELRDTIDVLLEVEVMVLAKAQDKPAPARMTLPPTSGQVVAR